jgi:hypothetical protein
MSDEFAKSAALFGRHTAGHQMTVLHEDGLYRHLRFANPQYGGIYSFDLITWPGCLTIRGDIKEAYTFVRLPDMFEFFRAGRRWGINPGYWSEKLDSDRDGVMVYDQDSFERQVKAHVVKAIREGDAPRGIGAEVTQEIFEWGDITHEAGARKELENFRFEDWTFGDTWEWNFRDWDPGFLRACHAIVWGVGLYDKVTRYGLKAMATPKAVAA